MIIFSSIQIRRGVNLLLDKATAKINPGQKVGLVGKNGSGKSTLFSLIKGEISTDAGEVSIPSQWQLSWVDQETPALDISAIDYVIDGDREYRSLEKQLAIANEKNDGNEIALLHSKLEDIDGWSIQARAATLLDGLGFSQEQIYLPVKSFSGGWRMRLNLAQALMCRSDLLLLDEPTNHLDLDAVMWLEKWLKNYNGTLILISHDRDFLDPLVNKIIHIEQQKLFEYTGNYSSFENQRTVKLAQQQSLYENQQHKIAHLQSYIDRFRVKATKARQAQSRLKMLERMEKIAPAHVDNPFQFSFRPAEALPSPLITMENVVAGYGDKIVLNNIKLNLVPGSRIGLLGRNGAGKSTLIKVLAGELQPKSGHILLAKDVQLGYFAQHQLEYLRADESPLWHLSQIADPKHTEQELRNYLGGFDFRGDKVKEAVKTFSGGEKARLVLALIVWQRPNLLLLDEPTNHLDLDMRQALTEALIDFEGAIVVVSHDRHLLRSTTDEFYLVHDQLVEPFNGDLEDYQKWLNNDQKDNKKPETEIITPPIENLSAQDKKELKRKEAEFRAQMQPLKRALQQTENRIEQIRSSLDAVEQQLVDPQLYDSQNKTKLTDLLLKQNQLKIDLDTQEKNWLDIQEQLDNFVLIT
ncbi:ABC transporter ATP-binding protein [Frischella perrara]|uniref:ABC transporter ATP-binding protein n=1 Tax=Frischella perrara TaxID=1267021 RepID=UPI0023EF7350|nr:ABC transporter ATP-binding protein [Frischella perrara]MCT6875103.1 ABC transporter ATP-binding protein [Frischella perrara]